MPTHRYCYVLFIISYIIILKNSKKMETINLEEIAKQGIGNRFAKGDNELMNDILSIMKEACYRTVDLCSENADTMDNVNHCTIVNKDSILETKNQII